MDLKNIQPYFGGFQDVPLPHLYVLLPCCLLTLVLAPRWMIDGVLRSVFQYAYGHFQDDTKLMLTINVELSPLQDPQIH